MKDSYGRKINYLRISITDRCNLRCRYCMPKEGIGKVDKKEILTLGEIEDISKTFVELGIDKIRITGGEPLLRKGVVDLIDNLSKMEGLKEIAMTTNGLMLKKYGRDLKRAGLNRVNVSLDTLDKDKYTHITRGGKLGDVLEGIEEANRIGLDPMKINTVLIGGFNDDEIEDFIYLIKKYKIDVRFIELMPIGEAAPLALKKYISNKSILEKFSGLKRVENEDISSPAVYYKFPEGKGRIGIINPISCKFCNNCNRLRLTSQGKLKLCLHSDREIDLKEALRKGENIKDIIEKAIDEKPKSHHLKEGEYIEKNMVQIGG